MKFRQLYLLIVFLLYGILVQAQSENTDYQYALIEAVKQKNIGNIPGAMELYSMVLKENNSVAVAHYELGTLLAMTGDKEQALMHLSEANGLDPDNDWYFNSYIDVLLLNEEFKTASELLKTKLKQHPEDVDLLYKQANVHYLAGKTGKAIRVLEGIERKFGVSDKIILLKATIYEKKKEYLKALMEVDRIIDLFPESVEYHVVAAELAMSSKNNELARKYYQQVLDLDSLNIYAITNLTDFYREKKDFEKSFFYLNKSFQSDNINYDKKMAILSYYLSDEYFFNTYPNSLELLINTMLNKYPEKREIHLFASDFFIQTRKFHDALLALEPILKSGEKRYELWRQGILLANATNQTRSLLKISTGAYNIFPDSIEVIFYKGIAEFESENYLDVVATFSPMNLAKTKNKEILSQARALLAEAYNKLGSYSISDSLFRRIIKEEPANYLIKNNFGYYLSLRGESLLEAKELSFETIKNNPGNATYLDTYAWILFKLEEYEEAGKYIKEALKFGGENDPDVNEHAADIHKALGSIHLARSFYQKAILLGGNTEDILLKLDEIKGQYDE